jgi:phage-related holin
MSIDTVWLQLQVWLAWLWSQWQTQILVYHILANFVVALAATIYTKELLLARVPEFLYRKILPYTLVYAVFAFVGESLEMAAIATAAWATLEMALVGDLLDNLKKLGLPIPDLLTKRDSCC